MLDHYTTPGESIEIRDNQTIYSLLTDRLARTGADTVIAAKKIGPAAGRTSPPANSTSAWSQPPRA